MTNENLLKNESTYLKLMIFTGLTGGYNFYLDRNKRALGMMVTFIISLILLIPVSDISMIGIFTNIFLWIRDCFRLRKDVKEYNESMEAWLLTSEGKDKILKLKNKNTKDYKLSVLTFGLIGLEGLYIENYSLKSVRFFVNGLFLLFYLAFITIFFVGMLYVSFKYPGEQGQGAMWMVIIFIWLIILPFTPIMAVIFPVLIPVMIVYTLYKIAYKIYNMDDELLEFNNELGKLVDVKLTE